MAIIPHVAQASTIDAAASWVPEGDYTQPDTLFSHRVTQTTAVDANGVKLTADTVYNFVYKVGKVAHTAATLAEIALWEVISAVPEVDENILTASQIKIGEAWWGHHAAAKPAGVLLDGETFNNAQYTELVALSLPFITDNGDGTSTVAWGTDFPRPKTTALGVHVNDTTARNGLRFSTLPAGNSVSGGNFASAGSSNTNLNGNILTNRLLGDAETAPNHRGILFGVWGKVGQKLVDATLTPVATLNSDIELSSWNAGSGTGYSATFTGEGRYDFIVDMDGVSNSAASGTIGTALRNVTDNVDVLSKSVEWRAEGGSGNKVVHKTVRFEATLEAGKDYVIRPTLASELNSYDRYYAYGVAKPTGNIEAISPTDTVTDFAETGTPLSATSTKQYVLQYDGAKIVNVLAKEYESTANGSFECDHLTGVLQQWGTKAGGQSARTVTLPVAFGNTDYVVTGAIDDNLGSGLTYTSGLNIDSKSTGSFVGAGTFIPVTATAGGRFGQPWMWHAVGVK